MALRVMSNFQMSVEKFDKACVQLDAIRHLLATVEIRHARAVAYDNVIFMWALEPRVRILQDLRDTYFNYICRLSDRIDDLGMEIDFLIFTSMSSPNHEEQEENRELGNVRDGEVIDLLELYDINLDQV